MKGKLQGLFLGFELILYAAFLLMDLLHIGDTTVLKYISIGLVGITGLLYAADSNIRWALILTVAADIFLLVLNDYYSVGIALFLLVQICYALYLDDIKGLIPRMVCALLVFGLFYKEGFLESLAAGYITLFLCNLIRAGKQFRLNPLFFLGMLLFFCCDLCVGIYHISTGALYEFARVAMWGFYLPGQVLILLSNWKSGGTTE